MHLLNLQLENPVGRIAYFKNIEQVHLDDYCKEIGYLFLKNKDFREQLRCSARFSMFGYQQSAGSGLYVPCEYLKEKRFCAYSQLTGAQTNTAMAGMINIERKMISNYLNCSSLTTATHFQAINLRFGEQTDQGSMNCIQKYSG